MPCPWPHCPLVSNCDAPPRSFPSGFAGQLLGHAQRLRWAGRKGRRGSQSIEDNVCAQAHSQVCSFCLNGPYRMFQPFTFLHLYFPRDTARFLKHSLQKLGQSSMAAPQRCSTTLPGGMGGGHEIRFTRQKTKVGGKKEAKLTLDDVPLATSTPTAERASRQKTSADISTGLFFFFLSFCLSRVNGPGDREEKYVGMSHI